MAKEVTCEVLIHAPPGRVWGALADFDRFPAWNPFIRKAKGKLAVGERLRISLKLPSGGWMVVSTKLLHVERGRELRWVGHLLVPGLVDGEHQFLIEPIDESTVRFTQRETFSGLLVPVLWWKLKRDACRGFNAMNEALKKMLEGGKKN